MAAATLQYGRSLLTLKRLHTGEREDTENENENKNEKKRKN